MDNVLKKFFQEWGIPLLCAAVLVGVIHTFVFFNVKVPSESMYPTIKVGDKIFVTRIYGEDSLKRGDILVFDSDELDKRLIKRLIGLPGDKLEFKEDGTLYINGEKIDEPYVKNNDNKAGVFNVPEHCYFFAGDNRSNSLDARSWQNPYINYSDIQGKARFIIQPFSRFGKLQ